MEQKPAEPCCPARCRRSRKPGSVPPAQVGPTNPGRSHQPKLVPSARVGGGFAAPLCRSPRLLLSVGALQHASSRRAMGCALSPSTHAVAVTDLDADPFPRHSSCCLIHWHPPGNPASSLPLNGLRLILVGQMGRAGRNLLLSNLSCAQLCSWLCPEPGWDTRLLEGRYKAEDSLGSD